SPTLGWGKWPDRAAEGRWGCLRASRIEKATYPHPPPLAALALRGLPPPAWGKGLRRRQVLRPAQVRRQAFAHQLDEVLAVEAVDRRLRRRRQRIAEALQRVAPALHVR